MKINLVKAPQESEFRRMLTRFKQESQNSLDKSSRIVTMVDILSRIPNNDPGNQEKSPETLSINEQLWQEIDRFNEANNRLDVVIDHLEKVIGD